MKREEKWLLLGAIIELAVTGLVPMYWNTTMENFLLPFVNASAPVRILAIAKVTNITFINFIVIMFNWLTML